MMPRHHPDDETLSAYVAGSLGEMQSVSIATHLTLCPDCRDLCEGFDELGGVLLSEIADEPVDSSTLDNVLDQLESPDVVLPARPDFADDETCGLVPQPIRERLPGPLGKLVWKKLGRRVQYIDLAANESGVTARLLRLPAGFHLPTHTHSGNEVTVVLSGGFSDQFGHYLRGDIATRDETEKHKPVVDDGEDCLCFAVTDAPLRLTGPIGFLFNRLINW
jgi:putative transcriptional regulator